MNIKTFEGEMVVDNAKFGIVISRFNSFLVESLLSGAVDTILRHGGKEADIQTDETVAVALSRSFCA